jgi:hypothetical protein
MFEGLKGMGREAGRDPAALELSVRANVAFSEAALGEARADFSGTLEQIAGGILAIHRLGAAELLFDVQFSPGVKAVDDMLAHMEPVWQITRLS